MNYISDTKREERGMGGGTVVLDAADVTFSRYTLEQIKYRMWFMVATKAEPPRSGRLWAAFDYMERSRRAQRIAVVG